MAVWFGLLMAAPAILHSCPQAMANMAAATEAGAGPFKLQGTALGEDGQPTGMLYAGGVVVLKPPMIVG